MIPVVIEQTSRGERSYVSYHIPAMPTQDDVPDWLLQQESGIYLNLVCNYLPS